METIELTPELVFERVSEVGSPPSSMLSYNSARGSSLSGSGSSRRHTDTMPSPRSDRHSPKKRALSPLATDYSPGRNRTVEDAAPKVRQDRGYYSLGSGIAKASKLNKAKATKPSEYGVAISIKGIKGHPFVILEDKENHRHMVPAPDHQQDSASDSSDKRLHNGHVSEPEEPTPKAPPRRAGTLNKDWRSKQPDNQRSKPDVVHEPPSRAKSLTRPTPKTKNSPSEPPNRLVKPSEIKAQQKANKPPATSSLHMRSPRARNAHDKGPASIRSRSLSPNRALANSKANRSRSTSPPRRGRNRTVDQNNMQPVSNLIGFFETGDPNEVVPPKPKVVQSRPGRVSQRPRYESPKYESPNKNMSPIERRPRIDSKEVEVTPASKKTSLTVTTATVPSKPGTTPVGRYFALTSPATKSPMKSPFGSTTPTPKLVPLKKEDAGSTSSSSSDTGMSTDEGTLNLLSDDSRSYMDRGGAGSGNKYSTPQPWQRLRTGSSGKGGDSPTKTSEVNVPSQPKDAAAKSWKAVAERALAKERRVVPVKVNHAKLVLSRWKKPLYPLLVMRNWHEIASFFDESTVTSSNQIKRSWRRAAKRALADEKLVVPVTVKRSSADYQEQPELVIPVEEEIVLPKTAENDPLAFSTVKGSKITSLLDLVKRMSKPTMPEPIVDKNTGKTLLVSHLSIGRRPRLRQIVEDLVIPAKVDSVTPDSEYSEALDKREPAPVSERVTRADGRQPPESSNRRSSPSPVSPPPPLPKTAVSTAKIIGPSHQLLRKTRRRRNAQRLTSPDGRALSGSEWSESEYSDAESLGAPLRISDDEEDEPHQVSKVETDAPLSPTSTNSNLDEPRRSHKKSSSIVFGKISSQDVTKKSDDPVTQSNAEQQENSAAPSVAELQQHIAELRGTVKHLQETADDNLDNYQQIKDLQRRLEAAERAKQDLEDEIVEGRKMLRNLETKLDAANRDLKEHRLNERRDRIVKQQKDKDISELKSELSDVGDELERLKSDSASKTDKDELKEELERLQKDYDNLLREQNERQEILNKRETEVNALKKALREESDAHDEEVEMMRKMHEDVLSRLRDELENLRQESVSAVEARPRLEEQVAALKDEVESLHKRRGSDSSSRTSSSSGSEEDTSPYKEHPHHNNKDVLKRLHKELKGEESKSANLRHEVNSLQRKLNNANDNRYHADRIEQLTQELATTKQEKKKVEGSIASLDLQRSTLKSQLQEARQEREDGEIEIRNLETESTRLKGRIMELENEVERLKKELNRTRRNLEAQVCDLEHQVTESDRRMSELQTEKANLETSLSEAKVVADPTPLSQQGLHDLERKKRDLERALSVQTDLAEQRRKEIAELTEELRRLSTADEGETAQHLEQFKRNAATEMESLKAQVEAKAKALRESDRTNGKLQEELRRMDLELEEELKERESTVAEYKQVERNLHELEARIARSNREKEEMEREIKKLQDMLSLTEDDRLNLEEKIDGLDDERRELNRQIHELKEDVKDKDMEIDELKCRVNTAEALPDDASRLSELEHDRKMSQMQISGLKQALEAKHADVEEVEMAKGKLQQKLKESDARCEDAVKQLREVEKKRRHAAKEAEDLTIALSSKVASLDEAQRKLRRLDTQMSDMEEAATLATSIRLELDRAKRNHNQELARLRDENKESQKALAASERLVSTMEQELNDSTSRYETIAAEAMELERQRRNAANLAATSQQEVADKSRSLARAEDKLAKVEEDLAVSERRVDSLLDQLRKAERQRKDAELASADARSSLEEKEKELKDANRRIRKLHSEMDNASDSQHALDELEASRRDVSNDVTALREEIEELKRRLREEEERVEDLKEKLSKSDKDLEKEQKRAEVAERERDLLRGQLNTNQQELANRIGALKNTHDHLCNMEQRISDFETQRGRASDHLQRAESDKQEARSKLEQLAREQRASEEKVRSAEEGEEKAQHQADVALKRADDLMEEVEVSRKQILLLEREVALLKEELEERDEDKKKSDNAIEALNKQVELLQREMEQRSEFGDKKAEELKGEVAGLEEELKTVEEELRKTEKEKNELEEKLSKMEVDGAEQSKENESSARKELQQLRDSLDERTQQVYAAEDTIYRQKEVIEELTSLQQTAEKSSLEQMDAYMAESDNQFEQLKSHLQEKSDQLRTAQSDKEGLEKELEALTVDLERATSDAQRTRSSHQEEQRRLEEVEKLLEELGERLKAEQRENDSLREELSGLKRKTSESSSDAEAKEEVEELEAKLHEAEEEKEDALHKLTVLIDQVGQLHNELEMEKSQVSILQDESNKQKHEIERLTDALDGANTQQQVDGADGELQAAMEEKIASLEEKLQQEASELNAIDTHHRKTEMKLREVLKQAEIETDKANSEKEMMSIRAMSLKQQLNEMESKLATAEEERHTLEEMLQEEKEANFELRKTIHLRLPNSNAKPPAAAAPSGNLFTSV